MRKRIIGAALAASMLAVVGGSALPASAARTRVKIVNFAFKPKRVEIAQGTKVIWINKDSEGHTATSRTGLWDTGVLNQGERSDPVRFNDTGVFRYYCEIHPDMRGKVISVDV